MKASVMSLACAVAVAWCVLVPARAQTRPSQPLTVLPPPSINDPGAKPVPEKRQARSGASAAPAGSARAAGASTAIPIPALPGAPRGATRDARGNPPPTVRVRRHKGNLIEEYYDGGQLYMVRVHPKHGVPYSYFVSKGHTLTRSPGAPPVSPVLYKVLEWDKPPPPPENEPGH